MVRGKYTCKNVYIWLNVNRLLIYVLGINIDAHFLPTFLCFKFFGVLGKTRTRKKNPYSIILVSSLLFFPPKKAQHILKQVWSKLIALLLWLPKVLLQAPPPHGPQDTIFLLTQYIQRLAEAKKSPETRTLLMCHSKGNVWMFLRFFTVGERRKDSVSWKPVRSIRHNRQKLRICFSLNHQNMLLGSSNLNLNASCFVKAL